MNIIISKEQFIDRIVNLKLGEGFDFSDISYNNEGDLDIDDYLEDHHRVEVIDFYDSITLLIGGYGGNTIATDFQLHGCPQEENECNVTDIVEAFLELYPMEHIVVEVVETR